MPGLDEHEESDSPAVHRSSPDHVLLYERVLPALPLRFTLTPLWLPAQLRNPLFGYIAAVVMSAVTVVLTARLVVMISGFAYAGGLSLLGTLIVALGWGIGPSVLSALLSSLVLNFYVLSPRFAWNFESRRDAISFLVFLAVGIAISLLTSDLAYQHQEARRTQARLAAALASEQRALAAAEAEMQARGQAMAEVERERLRLREIFEHVPAEIVLYRGPDHTIDFVNRNYAQAARQTPEQLVGRPLGEAFPEVAGQSVFEALDQVYRTGEPCYMPELLVRRDRDGDGIAEDAYKSVAFQPLRDARGVVVGVFTHGMNVTAQVLARRRLDGLAHQVAAERDRLQQVLDVLPVAVLIADTDGRVVMANQSVQELVGVQMLGRRISAVDAETARLMDARRLDGTPYPPAELPLSRAVLYGKTSRGEQIVFQNRVTGKQTPVLVVGAPLHDAGGTRIAGMAVFQDISSIKDLERQRDEFLASVSHDLKNPLTAILAMSSLLTRYAAQLPGSEQERIVQGVTRIGHIAGRMTGQIDELLDLSRVQMGQPLDLHLEPVDVVELLASLVAEYQQGSDRHSIRFAPDVPSLVGHYDPARLERALVNVLVNAIKYSPRGGEILVTLHAADQVEGSWVTIRVSDHGVGIPAAEVSRVFDRFYRASNVAGQMTGTGLGLAGVRHVVAQHGGTVDLESNEGAGTTVTIRLPYQQLDTQDPSVVLSS